MGVNRAKTLYLWGFLHGRSLDRGGTPLQTGFLWRWRDIRFVLEELGNASNNLKYVHDAFYWVFLLVIVCRIDRDETQLLWI